jgi:hypothetical protein
MATPEEISDCINGLAVHCRTSVMTPLERGSWLRDWCVDLRDYPIEAIRRGCQQWRSTATRAGFPMLSELRPLIDAANISKGPAACAKVWRPLDDGEYAALPIRAKIEHRMILAMDCRHRAGPQWSGGSPTLAADMPQRWHDLRAEADRHEAEAGRLREQLSSYDRSAA